MFQLCTPTLPPFKNITVSTSYVYQPTETVYGCMSHVTFYHDSIFNTTHSHCQKMKKSFYRTTRFIVNSTPPTINHHHTDVSPLHSRHSLFIILHPSSHTWHNTPLCPSEHWEWSSAGYGPPPWRVTPPLQDLVLHLMMVVELLFARQ